MPFSVLRRIVSRPVKYLAESVISEAEVYHEEVEHMDDWFGKSVRGVSRMAIFGANVVLHFVGKHDDNPESADD